MKEIHIIFVGPFREKYFSDAASEYLKRIAPTFKVIEKEIREETVRGNPTEHEIGAALEKEADRILEYLDKTRAKKIALCIEGKELSSVELASFIEKSETDGFSSFAFVIGSSAGLSERVKKACDFRLSMSKMTFPHKIARIMLLEQIYRASNILSGGKYHK